MDGNKFKVDDEVEFYSGGRWKPGVVVTLVGAFHTYVVGIPRPDLYHKSRVRIRVGDKVCVIRLASKCRRMAE